MPPTATSARACHGTHCRGRTPLHSRAQMDVAQESAALCVPPPAGRACHPHLHGFTSTDARELAPLSHIHAPCCRQNALTAGQPACLRNPNLHQPAFVDFCKALSSAKGKKKTKGPTCCVIGGFGIEFRGALQTSCQRPASLAARRRNFPVVGDPELDGCWVFVLCGPSSLLQASGTCSAATLSYRYGCCRRAGSLHCQTMLKRVGLGEKLVQSRDWWRDGRGLLAVQRAPATQAPARRRA